LAEKRKQKLVNIRFLFSQLPIHRTYINNINTISFTSSSLSQYTGISVSCTCINLRRLHYHREATECQCKYYTVCQQ